MFILWQRTALRERSELCSFWEKCPLSIYNAFLKLVMSSNSPAQDQLWLVRVLFLQLENWFKGRNVMWVIRSMCLKVSFSKVIFRSLNLLPKSWDFLRSGEKGPYCRLWRRSKNICLQPCHGRSFARVLLPWSRMLIFCSIYCAIEFNFFFLTK